MFQKISNRSIKIKFFSKKFFIQNNLDKIDFSLIKEFNQKNFLIPNQTHSNNVIFSNKPGVIHNCDGVFTYNPKVTCLIKVADCMPIFFAHQDLSFYGVIHAGWKGLTKGILKETSILFTKHKLNFNEIDIYIGPSIQKCCFEVSQDIIDKFPIWSIKPRGSGKFMVNLQKIAFEELTGIGFNKTGIKISSDCSFCKKNNYYSYRRDGEKTGRMIGLISNKV
tara:strand:- start:1478 stop:2143 length:666 start_codon:yes stop_codon:yes gene_type:complete